jgi:hypothetical protein
MRNLNLSILNGGTSLVDLGRIHNSSSDDDGFWNQGGSSGGYSSQADSEARSDRPRGTNRNRKKKKVKMAKSAAGSSAEASASDAPAKRKRRQGEPTDSGTDSEGYYRSSNGEAVNSPKSARKGHKRKSK